MVSVEYPARIEDAVRVQALFQIAHQFDFVPAPAIRQEGPFHDADAVFGRDRALQFADQAIDHFVELQVQGAGFGPDVDDNVQIAVADMAEQAENGLGPFIPQAALDFLAEVAHVGHVHADVVGM